MSFSQLDNPDQVMVGMRLYLKSPQTTSNHKAPDRQTPDSGRPQKSVRHQQPSSRLFRNLSPISEAKASQPVEAVIAKQADWRTYGPLQVDWANWRPMGGAGLPSLNDRAGSLSGRELFRRKDQCHRR